MERFGIFGGVKPFPDGNCLNGSVEIGESRPAYGMFSDIPDTDGYSLSWILYRVPADVYEE